MPPTVQYDVSDDEVLRAMNTLDLDAEDLCTFRAVRHFLRHGLPLCCILFTLRIVENIPPWLPPKIEAWLDSPVRAKQEAAVFLINFWEYASWAHDRVPKQLHYLPCPACVLAGTVRALPAGCPICADAARDGERTCTPPCDHA